MYNDRLVIVSLTSWTARINTVYKTIDSILNQTFLPDMVELNLSLTEFPNKIVSLPNELQQYIKKNSSILHVNFVDGDTKAFKKIIPTVKKYYTKKYYLLSIDDDCLYFPTYIESTLKHTDGVDFDFMCMSNTGMAGSRMIYKSECFTPDFWQYFETLPKTIISNSVDDQYYLNYLTYKNKKLGNWLPEKNDSIILLHDDMNPLSDTYLKPRFVDGTNKIMSSFKNYKPVNFVIVHYNTPKLTEALVKSINKFVGENCFIYVFDNSNIKPFEYKQHNLIVLDNTHSEIINFDEELNKYPNHVYSIGSGSGWGSFKHCISVDKCFDLIDDSFILLDSDVLLKQDASVLFNDTYYACGDIETFSWNPNNYQYPAHKRIVPFISFINVNKCKDKNIRYFNYEYMDGLYDSMHINNKAELNKDSYDTGCWFYECIERLPIRKIKWKDYVVHYHGGSWAEESVDEHLSPDAWLKKYRELYTTEVENNNTKQKFVVDMARAQCRQLKPYQFKNKIRRIK